MCIRDSQNVGDEKVFISMFIQRQKDMYHQKWRAEVNETSSGRLYKHIKEDFHFENYLNLNVKGWRVALTKVRLSSHLFLIERGRWGSAKMLKEDRICSVCQVIEDEYHCIVECPRFLNIREDCLVPKDRQDFLNYVQCATKIHDTRKFGRLCLKIMCEYRRELLG